MTLCGALKSVSGRLPLVCNQPAGHAGPHGISQPGMPPHVRWERV
jgi:hypothetical protein